MTREILLVGIGGFAGSVARYLLYVAMSGRWISAFPLATLLINVSGCFAIGVLGAWIERGAESVRALAPLLTVGLLGGYTTFSTFGNETWALLRAGAMGSALLSVAGNVVLGVLAVWAGRAVAG